MMEPRPYPGLPVLYTALLRTEDDAETVLRSYPGIVTSLDSVGVNLIVFFDHKVIQVPIGHPTSVPYSAIPKDHSWQFIGSNAVSIGMDIASIPSRTVLANVQTPKKPAKSKPAAKKKKAK